MCLLWARFTGWVKRLFGRAKPSVPEEDLQRYMDDGGAVTEEDLPDEDS